MSQQINLYDPLFRKRGFSFTSATAMLYGIGIAIAAAALAAAYQDHKLREVSQQARSVESALKEAQAQRDKLAAEQVTRKPDPRLGDEIAALSEKLKSRQEVIAALQSGAVGTQGGFSDYLRAFSQQSVSGLWLTSFNIASGGNDLSISGRALSADLVPNYLKRLNQETIMQGRQFAALRIDKAPPPAKDAKDTPDAKAQPLARYLDFTISTQEPGTVSDKQSAEQAWPRPLLSSTNLSATSAAAGSTRANVDPKAGK